MEAKKQMGPELKVKSFIWKDDGLNEITGVILNGERHDFNTQKTNKNGN